MTDVIDTDALIANAERDFPALYAFFATAFAPTWSQKFQSWRAAVSKYNSSATLEQRVASVREIDLILKSGLDNLDVDQLLSPGLECNYVPSADGLGSIEWLLLLRPELSVI